MNQRLVGRVIFPLHERLKRKPTFERLRELERTQWLVPERLAEYRLDRLRQLLTFADHHVPYYHALFAEHGLVPARVQSLDDLGRLPFLGRDLVQSRSTDLRARAALPGMHARSSGGSTGTPVTVMVDMGRMGMGEAGRLRAQGWFGVEPGAREIVLWGVPLRLDRNERIRRVRDWFLNTRVLSAFDMGEAALRPHARDDPARAPRQDVRVRERVSISSPPTFSGSAWSRRPACARSSRPRSPCSTSSGRPSRPRSGCAVGDRVRLPRRRPGRARVPGRRAAHLRGEHARRDPRAGRGGARGDRPDEPRLPRLPDHPLPDRRHRQPRPDPVPLRSHPAEAPPRRRPTHRLPGDSGGPGASRPLRHLRAA